MDLLKPEYNILKVADSSPDNKPEDEALDLSKISAAQLGRVRSE